MKRSKFDFELDQAYRSVESLQQLVFKTTGLYIEPNSLYDFIAIDFNKRLGLLISKHLQIHTDLEISKMLQAIDEDRKPTSAQKETLQ